MRSLVPEELYDFQQLFQREGEILTLEHLMPTLDSRDVKKKAFLQEVFLNCDFQTSLSLYFANHSFLCSKIELKFMGSSSGTPSFAPHLCLICMKSSLCPSLSASISLNSCYAVKHQLQACLKRQAESSCND